MKKIFLSVVLTLITSLAQAHGDGESRITIEPEAQGNYSAGDIHYSFQLFDDQANKALSDTDLVETHTKILHFITYDSSKNEFNHVHPTFDGKMWAADFKWTKNGVYFVWAQGQLKDGTEFSTFVKTQVVNGAAEIPVVDLGDHRKASDHSTVVELDNSQLKAGKMAMLNFKVTRDDGQVSQITPYLGAFAHVIAVSPDGDELTHVHPMQGSKPNTGMIHATFPTGGDYRIWVQLMDRGELKTIPLSVTVSK